MHPLQGWHVPERQNGLHVGLEHSHAAAFGEVPEAQHTQGTLLSRGQQGAAAIERQR